MPERMNGNNNEFDYGRKRINSNSQNTYGVRNQPHRERQNSAYNGAPRTQNTGAERPYYRENPQIRQQTGVPRPQRTQGTYNRPPQNTANRRQNTYFSWQTVFVALLAGMVLVGIIATVVNSKKNAAAYADNDRARDTVANDSADDILNDYAEETLGANLAVTYAIKTDDTLKLTDEIASDYAIMIDLGNNTVVAEKGGDEMIYPASMTKVMTLIVAYENCKNLDDTFTMTAEITDPLFKEGASVAGFSVGEEVTVRDLLYGAILPSGADATDALAIYTAGSIEKFVAMMNKKVLQLGLSNTHFSNPSGLHDKNHYSTPHEMALIFEYAMKIDGCREILSTYKYTTALTDKHPDGIPLTSTMFSRMKGDESGVAEIIAGKTGYTNEGLHCLVSLGKRNGTGKEYVLVTAHAAATYDPIYDCINLYKKLFGE